MRERACGAFMFVHVISGLLSQLCLMTVMYFRRFVSHKINVEILSLNIHQSGFGACEHLRMTMPMII